MKKIASLLLLLLVLVPGCKKDDSSPVTPETPKSLVVTSISGQLPKWTYYLTYQAKLGNFGSSVIDENGNFAIAQLSSPSDDQLTNVINFFDSTKTQPTISDQSAKYYYVSELSIAKTKNPSKVIGYIQRATDYTAATYFSTSYIYFNKPVTLNGTATFQYNFGFYSFTMKENFANVAFEKGWNKIIRKMIPNTDYTSHVTTYEILREEPAGGSWIYSAPQTTITITGSENHAGLKFPFNIDFGFKRCAAIYNASEINAAGLVSKIGWRALTNKGDSRLIKIYMKEVSDSLMFAQTVSNIEEGASLVYDGSQNLPIANWNWDYISLMNPFPFSGTKHLLVIVETNHGGNGITDDCYCEYSITNKPQFISWGQNTTAPTGVGALSTDRPNINITIDAD